MKGTLLVVLDRTGRQEIYTPDKTIFVDISIDGVYRFSASFRDYGDIVGSMQNLQVEAW